MKKTIGAGRNKGFTLIELLVVISIISLLSSVVLASLNGARVKADDTQRNQIVGEYVKALALAYDKAGTGQYPATGDLNTYCLGDYAPVGTYGTGTCQYGLGNKNESATVLGAIGGAGGYLPSLPTLKSATFGANVYQGPFYRCQNAGNCTTAEIEWYLDQPGQKCIKGAQTNPTSPIGGTKCVLTLN